jgi:hypothetical protein
VRAARKGDFEAFFARELGSLEAIAYGLTGRRGLAEELAQEAMLAVYRRWDTVAGYDDPAAFARRVVANKAVSAFRRLAAEARAVNRGPHRRHPRLRRAQRLRRRTVGGRPAAANRRSVAAPEPRRCSAGAAPSSARPDGPKAACRRGSPAPPRISPRSRGTGAHEGDRPISGAGLPSQLWRSYMEQAADATGLEFPN